jgi:hypothetical protein
VVATLRGMVQRLDPRALSCADAVVLVEFFAEVERLAVAGKTIAAGRAAEGDAWRQAGDRSPAEWLARRTGGTVSDARAGLETASKLDAAPGTDAAFRNGELSQKQADALAPAAAADPSSEARLVEMARYQGLQKLRDEAARVRAAAEPDQNARHERIRKERSWRRWTRPDGARCGTYVLTPEAAAVLEAAAQPFIDARIDQARRAGEHEPSEAYAADGLVDMAATTMHRRDVDDDDSDDAPDTTSGDKPTDPSGPPSAPSAPSPGPPRGGRGRRRLGERRELIGIVNLETLHRGHLHPGETCEIAGVGPVSIDTALDVFGDALLRIVIRDGKDIRTVAHTGRTANALQETAVLVRQHGHCGKPTCNRPISEIDHTTNYTQSHITTLDQLLGLCGTDHDLKTRHGHTYRINPNGSVTWIRPHGTEEHERPPP